jgi:hypothetical protein
MPTSDELFQIMKISFNEESDDNCDAEIPDEHIPDIM